jgi:alpha-galactosidase
LPPKITFIGAGSFVFARRLVTDVLTWPALQEATIALMDVNADKLETMAALARRMVTQAGTGAQVESTTDLREALAGANYVAVAIRVGHDRHNVEIPLRYGIDQAIGDTSGPGGVFYFLRNASAVVNIARTMQQECPDALMLNYTNPMVMLSWAVTAMTNIRYVGLCHSVQGTAMAMAEYIGAPFEEVSYWAAGINHMAWYLKFLWNGQDAYPLLWQAMQDPEIYKRDIVKWEVMKHFGAFVSESSIHMSEYVPYFRRTPELIDRHTDEKMWGVQPKGTSREERRAMWQKRRQQREEENRRLAFGDGAISIARSHEYFSRILNAVETNTPFLFNGNVPNTDLIANLPATADGRTAIVEVPILVDGCGLHPCHVGDLPPALAALNRSNLAVEELAVKGYLEKDRKCIYRAVQLDPLTASLLSLSEIQQMVDELFEAHQEYVDF